MLRAAAYALAAVLLAAFGADPAYVAVALIFARIELLVGGVGGQR
jgi:hypothetical protein